MGNILDKILSSKRSEIEALESLGIIMTATGDRRYPVRSMSDALLVSSTGIIAEFKRRSPSKGEIHPKAMASDVIPAYQAAGATACSVLTDTPFFGGALTDLAVARSVSSLPLLRKDFIISKRQITEAYNIGADAILLIAAALKHEEVISFTDYAHSLGLEVLFEIHNVTEIEKYYPEVDMVGVNNRDLTTFETDPMLSAHVARELPDDVVKVAESGLTSMQEVKKLRDMGFRGFLIGETFMKTPRPGETLKRFLNGEI